LRSSKNLGSIPCFSFLNVSSEFILKIINKKYIFINKFNILSIAETHCFKGIELIKSKHFNI
jgi:hypothetical protein